MGQNRYSLESRCLRANWLYSGKMVSFLVMLFYLGKSGYILAMWLSSGKWLNSGKGGFYSDKVVVLGQKWFYSGQNGFNRA